MKYNLAVQGEADKAFEYLTELVGKEAIAEVVKISPKRSLNQNAYLHLLLSAFGAHFGYSLEEAKQIYKKLNHGVYSYEKNNRRFERSSADLTKEEMAKTIDLFMQKSAQQGYQLPPATDQAWLREVENEIERSKYYL